MLQTSSMLYSLQDYHLAQKNYQKDIFEYLLRNWHILAVEAWNQYIHQGKGYFLLHDLSPFTTSFSDIRKEYRPLFCETDKRNDLSICMYNPKKEILIQIQDKETLLPEMFMLTATPTPPTAYKIFHNIPGQ